MASIVVLFLGTSDTQIIGRSRPEHRTSDIMYCIACKSLYMTTTDFKLSTNHINIESYYLETSILSACSQSLSYFVGIEVNVNTENKYLLNKNVAGSYNYR